MTDVNNAAVREPFGQDDSSKITVLQNLILAKANTEKERLVSEARSSAADWITAEFAALEKDAEAVLSDARSRGAEIRRRQLMAAERERATEGLRLQSKLLRDAMSKFRDGLVKLRDEEGYADVLTALAASAARDMLSSAPLVLKLAALDSSLGDDVAARVNERFPNARMTFSREPVPILGGCWVGSADGRRQISSDWQTIAQEASDDLASRILEQL